MWGGGFPKLSSGERGLVTSWMALLPRVPHGSPHTHPRELVVEGREGKPFVLNQDGRGTG